MYLIIWVLVLGVVIWNIYAIGNTWVEARHAGGRIQFAIWAGAIITAIALTWNLFVVEAIIASMFGWLNIIAIEPLLNLGYFQLIPTIFLGGYALTLDS